MHQIKMQSLIYEAEEICGSSERTSRKMVPIPRRYPLAARSSHCRSG